MSPDRQTAVIVALERWKEAQCAGAAGAVDPRKVRLVVGENGAVRVTPEAEFAAADRNLERRNTPVARACIGPARRTESGTETQRDDQLKAFHGGSREEYKPL